MEQKNWGFGLRVEIAKDSNDVRYMITDDGVPIQDVCLWLDIISINSYLTGEKYAYCLLRYLRFLKANQLNYREVVSKNVIEEYIKNLLGLDTKVVNVETRMTFTALSNYITVLKSFYHWLEDERKVVRNPVTYSTNRTRQAPLVNTKFLYGQIWRFEIEESVLSRVTYRQKRSHLKWYTEDEVNAIHRNLPSNRDKTIFSISIQTGMRIGEILGLKLSHFEPHEPALKVQRQPNVDNRARAKTTERTLAIYRSLADEISSYILNERVEADIANSEYLFLNYKGRYVGHPLKPRNFLRILKDAGERSGLLRSEIRTHSGRSTRTQELLELMIEHPELGITPTFIDEELGWRSERSKRVYEKGFSLRQKRKILDLIAPVTLKIGKPE